MKKNLRQLIIMLCLMAAPLGVKAQSIVFHLADGDRTITMPATFTVTPADDLLLIGIGNGQNLTLSKDDVQYVTYRDADGSQRVDVADVATIVSLLIGSAQSSGTAPANVEAVDLGLPSGTLWANMNIGATKPEDYGDYFAWGETETKDEYGVSTYKWCNGSYTTMTKYCSRSEWGYNGFTDNKTQLDPEDDAAYVNLGSDWCMPTYANIQELLDNCTTEWTTINSVNGWRFTGPNGNSIFLPAAGCIKDDVPSGVGMWGYYWSSTFSLNDENEDYAWMLLGFPNSGAERTSAPRDIGRSVRPVRQD